MVTWSSNHNDQQEIISRIEGKLKLLRTRVRPITLYSAAAPTDAEMSAAWNLAYPPGYSPQLYEELQHVDPNTNTIKSHYVRINDILGSSSSGSSRATVNYPATPALWTKLDEIWVTEAGGGTALTFSSINQSYRSLYVYIQCRDSAAATNALTNIKFNGLSATNYGESWQSANSTLSLGTESAAAVGLFFTSPAATSVRSYYFEGLLKVWDYTSTARPFRVHLKGTTLWGAPYTTSTTNNYNLFGIYNAAPAACTSLSLNSATGFQAGTRLVLYGV